MSTHNIWFYGERRKIILELLPNTTPSYINPSLAEHDMSCLSKQCRSSSVGLSALFIIKYVNFYKKYGSSNLIGWKLLKIKSGQGILIYSAGQGLNDSPEFV